MATWALLQNLTTFDFRSVTSDGTDIYFVQYGGGSEYHVFKYDTGADTITQISNAASFSGTSPKVISNFAGGNVGPAIQWFGGNLYVGVFTTDAGSELRVYKYSGSGTAWTNVLTAANPGGRWGLFCTSSHLIVGPTNQAAGVIADSYLVTWAKYSANGTSWSNATVSNSPAYITSGAGLDFQRANAAYGQGVSPVLFDSSSHNVGEPDPDAQDRWFEWNGSGTFSITRSRQFTSGAWTPTDAWYAMTFTLVDKKIWFTDSSIRKYVTTLGDTPTTPTNHQQSGVEIFPVVSIGFIDQCGDHNGNFVQLSSGAWGTPETVTGGTAGISHAVRMSSDDGFLFAALGAQSAIYGRSEAFPPDGGNFALTRSAGGIPGSVMI